MIYVASRVGENIGEAFDHAEPTSLHHYMDGRIMAVNQPWLDNISAENPLYKRYENLDVPERFGRDIQALIDHCIAARQPGKVDLTLASPERRTYWTGKVKPTPDKHFFKGAYSTLIDETDRAIDPLTGLPTRRDFDRELDTEIRRQRRAEAQTQNRRAVDNNEQVTPKKPGYLVLLDLDDMKGINDTYGHPGGDSVLQTVGDVILQKIRPTDHPCRWGGDEIAILLTMTDEAGARAFVKRIKEDPAILKHTIGINPVPISFSSGYVNLSEGFTTAEDIVKSVDREMYHEKDSKKRR